MNILKIINFILLIFIVNCASSYHNRLRTKQLDFLEDSLKLNKIFSGREVEVLLKNKQSIKGIFINATSEKIIVSNNFVELQQIKAIRVAGRTSPDWVVPSAGTIGAIAGSIAGTKKIDLPKNTGPGTGFMAIKNPVLGAISGSLVGLLVGNILKKIISTEIQIEYIVEKKWFSTSSFNLTGLLRNWNKEGIIFPIKKNKLKKLLSRAKLIILNKSIGKFIDNSENKHYQIFPEIFTLKKAYIFKLDVKAKYFAIIIDSKNKAKIKALKHNDLMRIKSNLR